MLNEIYEKRIEFNERHYDEDEGQLEEQKQEEETGEITTSITHHVVNMDMSKDSTQNIPQEATRLKKLSKVTARYMQMDEFKDSDHHTGYFCYNCVYFMKPNHCAIVTDEGPDVYDKSSGETPYGICALWEPNKEEMR